MRRVVVTGIGIVNPLGIGRDAFWNDLVAGKLAISPITRFPAEGLPVQLAAEVHGFDATQYAPRRLIAKSDRFAHYAMAAADLALKDAELPVPDLNPFRTGISFGNNSGAWDLCERGFEEYYQQGPGMVNPWQATAWFPTAPQGFVSIRFGLRGFSKSFACDRASDACAVFFAVRSIRWGYNDVVLTGGCEAPITRLGMAAHLSTGELSRRLDPEHAYLPFDRDRNGLILGEGSTVLVLEEFAQAKRRGARIYGEVLAVEQRTGDPEDPRALESALTSALGAAACLPHDIDLVLADGCGTVAGDRTEALALQLVFGSAAARPRVSVPKAAYGHLYGASFSTELACGLLAMEKELLPPTAGTRSVSPDCDVRLVSEAVPAHVERVVVNGRSREGTNVCLVAARDIDG